MLLSRFLSCAVTCASHVILLQDPLQATPNTVTWPWLLLKDLSPCSIESVIEFSRELVPERLHAPNALHILSGVTCRRCLVTTAQLLAHREHGAACTSRSLSFSVTLFETSCECNRSRARQFTANSYTYIEKVERGALHPLSATRNRRVIALHYEKHWVPRGHGYPPLHLRPHGACHAQLPCFPLAQLNTNRAKAGSWLEIGLPGRFKNRLHCTSSTVRCCTRSRGANLTARRSVSNSPAFALKVQRSLLMSSVVVSDGSSSTPLVRTNKTILVRCSQLISRTDMRSQASVWKPTLSP